MRDTSLTFRQAVHARETGEVFIVLLEITDGVDTTRLSSDAVDTVSNGETYQAYPFDITLPDDPEEGVTKARITIDNVHRDIIAWIRGLASSPTVNIRIVAASDPDTVEAEYSNFELTNVHYDALTITGDLGIESFMGEPYPGDTFLPSRFPGLF